MGCWECEALTAHPVRVILGTPTGVIGKLSLCPACYADCYLPLVQPPVDADAPVHPALVVDPDRAGTLGPC